MVNEPIREIDKTQWGDGEWLSEPDEATWTDDATGYSCCAWRHPALGSWCGYVGIPPDHPLYGVKRADERCQALEVHGGITYAGQGIGNNEGLWWVGFDCHHAMDFMPAADGSCSHLPPEMQELWHKLQDRLLRTYRTLEYVREQCTELAAQIKRVRL